VSMTPAMHVFAGVVDTVDAPVGPLAVREYL
jgi:hypothetical protein